MKKNYPYLDELKPHQREWAIEQINMFKNSGFAVPYGLIKNNAEKIQPKVDAEVQKLAEQLQEDCHLVVKEIVSEKASYQDATNAWFFYKLAELQIQITQLNTK